MSTPAHIPNIGELQTPEYLAEGSLALADIRSQNSPSHQDSGLEAVSFEARRVSIFSSAWTSLHDALATMARPNPNQPGMVQHNAQQPPPRP
jgi:hypothetical protein